MVAIPDEYYTEEYAIQAAAFSVMDARTGFVIYESAQHELLYPASVTKVMTALIVLEEIENLSEEVVFSEHAVMSLPYYAARMNVVEGDSMTIHEALYGLMLPSGNDIANGLAEHVSGSIGAFVARMNERAAELGAHNTRFVNACGLPGDGQHVTAYDMALIMREAVRHPLFNEIIASTNFYIDQPMYHFPEGITVWNTNRMLYADGDYFNPWIIGGKTGFTNAAQHTLVSYARRGEHELIISVLYAPRRATFTDTSALLDRAFAIPVNTVFRASDELWNVPVMQTIDGEYTEIGTVIARGAGNLRFPVPEGMPEIRSELHLPEELVPPVRVGDVVGYKNFFVGDILVSEVEIISSNTILPRLTMPRARTETAASAVPEQGFSFAFEFSPFFAVLPLVAVLMLGALLAIMRRHRRLELRRRRTARVRYVHYE